MCSISSRLGLLLLPSAHNPLTQLNPSGNSEEIPGKNVRGTVSNKAYQSPAQYLPWAQSLKGCFVYPPGELQEEGASQPPPPGAAQRAHSVSGS